jgi:hypothetical protein
MLFHFMIHQYGFMILYCIVMQCKSQAIEGGGFIVLSWPQNKDVELIDLEFRRCR